MGDGTLRRVKLLRYTLSLGSAQPIPTNAHADRQLSPARFLYICGTNCVSLIHVADATPSACSHQNNLDFVI
jgi:hypothetical protein